MRPADQFSRTGEYVELHDDGSVRMRGVFYDGTAVGLHILRAHEGDEATETLYGTTFRTYGRNIGRERYEREMNDTSRRLREWMLVAKRLGISKDMTMKIIREMTGTFLEYQVKSILD